MLKNGRTYIQSVYLPHAALNVMKRRSSERRDEGDKRRWACSKQLLPQSADICYIHDVKQRAVRYALLPTQLQVLTADKGRPASTH